MGGKKNACTPRKSTTGHCLISAPRLMLPIMIWLRRALTVPLGLGLFVLLLVALVLLQIGDTFLNPGFYTDELRKAKIYEFVLGDLMTSSLNEARELKAESFSDDLDENPLVTLGLSTEDIVSSINRAVPPEWLQELVEETFDEVGRYITGERDGFEIAPRAGDQVVIMVEEIKALLTKADAYNLMFEELVIPSVEEALSQRLPFGLDITSDRLADSVRRTVPPEWVQAQVEAALDEVTPYATGESDTFEIAVELSDLVGVALQEIKGLLREAESYDLLYDEVIEPGVRDSLGRDVELPLGIRLTVDEVISALRQVAPPSWVREQAEMVIDDAAPYLTGEVDGFVSTVSLVDNKRDARAIIVAMARDKLNQAADELPKCKPEQTFSLASIGGLTGLPECIPPGVQTGAIVERMTSLIADGVESFALKPIPDNIRFTDSILRRTLTQTGAGENVDLLDDVRELIRDGWTYTDRDLRNDLRQTFGDPGEGDDAVETLDNVRAFLADGWTYTERDLREDMAEAGDQDTLRDFDRGRTGLTRARTLRLLLVYLPVLITLVAIGFLGGRGWSGRFVWAAAFLVVVSAALLVVAGPVYNAVAEPRLDDARDSVIDEIDLDSDFPNTERLVVDKLFETITSVAGGMASGVAKKSLILLIVGTVGLVTALGWGTITSLAYGFRR